MRPPPALARLAVALAAVLWAGCDSGDEGSSGPGFTIREQALVKVGDLGDGSHLMPNGRQIRPEGAMVRVDHHALGIVLSPDGSTVFATSGGELQHSVTAIDAASGAILDVAAQPRLFLGIAISPDGGTVYAAGAANTGIVVFDWDGASLSERARWEIEGYHGGIALSPDGSTLVALEEVRGGLFVLDTTSGQVLGTARTGPNPYAVVFSPDGTRAYVSSERLDRIELFDLSDRASPRRYATVPVQKNPEGLAVTADGSTLFVANADEDSVQVIDLGSREVTRTLDLRSINSQGYGTGPNSLAFSPDGSRLYVAQAVENRVAVVDLASFTVVGAVPTGWYPVGVAISDDGRRMIVCNAKGIGSGPDRAPDSIGLRNRSTVQLLDVPDDARLAELAGEIDAMNRRSAELFDVPDPRRFRNPVPYERGGSTPIEHVLIVVRENKTYDALFGDWPGGDGDPDFCSECDITPNIEALADRFASGDNYYSTAESSDQGHLILTTGISNTFHERVRNTDGRPQLAILDVFANPTVMPKKQAIFQSMVEHGIHFRNYGEAIGMLPDGLLFDSTYASWKAVDPPWNWQFSRDVDKLASRIEEWESEGLPPVAFMLFPNDHGLGCTPPFPTERSMVADNDLATGQLIEWLSRSEYWETSVVIIVEDDPQGSADHVDAHRSILVVVSPWVKRGYVSGVRYHEGNLLATLEHLVGMPPLTVYDELAQPFWDLFSDVPDLEPFTALPRVIPEEIAMPGTNCGFASRGLDLVDVDGAEELGPIGLAHRREGEAGREARAAGRDGEPDGAAVSRTWEAVVEAVAARGGEAWEVVE